MAFESAIEWTNSTWNPITGCTKVSQGCKNCYAERMAKRLKAMGNPRYVNGFNVTLHEDLLDLPLRWKTPRLIFVNSMSDLFHPDVPIRFIERVFQTMNEAQHHTFQVLTKRPDRALEIAKVLKWSKNIWMGTSVESQEVIERVRILQRIPAAVRFLSLEPLLGPLTRIPLKGIDWVIVGGESGPGARPMEANWVRNIRDQCLRKGVRFFFKQWGGTNKRLSGRTLDGRTWDDMPPMGWRVPH